MDRLLYTTLRCRLGLRSQSVRCWSLGMYGHGSGVRSLLDQGERHHLEHWQPTKRQWAGGFAREDWIVSTFM